MRTLAHPTRLRLLGLLRERGPQTAALLGTAVDEASGTISYHLGKLAAAGLIEEAADQGHDGRERWWRSAHDSTHWEDVDLLDSPEDFAASAALQHTISHLYAHLHDEYIASIPTLPREWVAAGASSDRTVRLTVAELAELRAELQAVGDKWETVSEKHVPDDGSESVFVVMQAYRRPA